MPLREKLFTSKLINKIEWKAEFTTLSGSKTIEGVLSSTVCMVFKLAGLNTQNLYEIMSKCFPGKDMHVIAELFCQKLT